MAVDVQIGVRFSTHHGPGLDSTVVSANDYTAERNEMTPVRIHHAYRKINQTINQWKITTTAYQEVTGEISGKQGNHGVENQEVRGQKSENKGGWTYSKVGPKM